MPTDSDRAIACTSPASVRSVSGARRGDCVRRLPLLASACFHVIKMATVATSVSRRLLMLLVEWNADNGDVILNGSEIATQHGVGRHIHSDARNLCAWVQQHRRVQLLRDCRGPVFFPELSLIPATSLDRSQGRPSFFAGLCFELQTGKVVMYFSDFQNVERYVIFLCL